MPSRPLEKLVEVNVRRILIETWFDHMIPPSHSGAYTCAMENGRGSPQMGSWEFAISHISIASAWAMPSQSTCKTCKWLDET